MGYKLINESQIFKELGFEEDVVDALSMYYDIAYKVAAEIVQYRADHKLSQKKLANKIGLSQSMICKLESGDYNFSIKKLCEVFDKLGMQVDITISKNETMFHRILNEVTKKEKDDLRPKANIGKVEVAA